MLFENDNIVLSIKPDLVDLNVPSIAVDPSSTMPSQEDLTTLQPSTGVVVHQSIPETESSLTNEVTELVPMLT